MKYLSVCSGIEAATVAWRPLGWKAAAFSEIEPFPAAVLAHHYPDTPNLGDMTKFKEWPDATFDVLVGGTPCQSFSVAGLRKGLDDPRGNLILTYLAIADRYRPQWLVWENVPGVLSSNGGKDFGTFLAGLGELGYGFAYRVLDAQYFGVPQRRRRVFVVGYLGDWRRAAAVLFEQHSLSGNPPPRRKKGSSIAPTIRAGTANGSAGHGARSGDSKDELITVVAALTANGVRTCGADDNQGQAGHLIAMHSSGAGFWQEGFGTLRAREQDSPENLVCGTLQANGKAAGSATQQDAESGLLVVHGTQDPYVSDIAFAQGRNNGGENVICQYGSIAGSLTARHDSSPCADRGQNIVAFGVGESPDLGHCLRSGASKADKHESTTYIASPMQVRRLTPTECERLQGFPDNYTNIPWRSKPEAPDGPRYKALGNSMHTGTMRWIGERIQMVSEMDK